MILRKLYSSALFGGIAIWLVGYGQLVIPTQVAAQDDLEAELQAEAVPDDTGETNAPESERPMQEFEQLTRQGVVLLSQGQFASAVVLFSRAIEINPRFVPAYFHRGQAFRKLEYFDLALKSLSKAAVYGRQFPDIYSERGEIHMELNNYREALEDFENAVELAPTNTKYLKNYGTALVKLGIQGREIGSTDALENITRGKSSLDHAIELLELAQKQGPHESLTDQQKEQFVPQVQLELAEAHFDRSLAQAELSDAEALLIDLQSAFQYKDDNVEYGRRLAFANHEQGVRLASDRSYSGEFVNHFEDAIKTSTVVIDTVFGNETVDQNETNPDAVQDSQEAVDEDIADTPQDNQEATDEDIADIVQDSQEAADEDIADTPQDSQEAADGDIADTPQDSQEGAVGDIADTPQDSQEGAVAVTYSEQEKEENYGVFTLRAAARIALANHVESDKRNDLYQAAIDDCNTLLELDPRQYTAMYYRGLAYRMMDDYPAALDSFTSALRIWPQYPDARLRRGIVWFHVGELSLALKDFGDSGSDPRPRFWAGLIYQRQGEHRKAIRAYSDAIRANPNYELAYSNRGLSYLQTGEYERAINDFDEVVLRNPIDADSFFHRGLAYENLNQIFNAINSLESAILADPDHEPANQRLQTLQTLR